MSDRNEILKYLLQEKDIDKKERSREKWRGNNPQYNKIHYAENREKELKRHKKYREDNKDKIAAHNKIYRQENKEHIGVYIKEWLRTGKGKALCRRKHIKRQVVLGLVPLNSYFEGAAAHHLDNVHVVYIPKKVHESIRHCLETGENMLEINSYALNYIQAILYPKEV